ncbi:hypothetical protein BASA50_005810 [Batrachochytrium salamandrivorans]|uniref:SCP domain-containing protein n=1 Tax=Batrachochytrium salamandrivorans TaxID=1357716 RepID=A0ABQ8FBN7_9FUNG|nr:hypothetical protein BASA60_007233 [Batrachochytrium salamandrivorans]KAH6574696.1 hypothetical protein BASA62_002341 [Batrachochytrium salamandrivorans]KAH6589128.1 hypothetical protein BASA61_005729 [Batrachochytrium salamandrivorans]KAH6595458.1 hypothetical protein BASA50_005810 [Batrachochytrium salamandrivorans]KAH9263316.1 hypothetical protein BASA83_013315 [Batrachochytrium salamandrivorans]
MLLSISLISIAMLNAVVDAQYGGYNAGSQYDQQAQQYTQQGYRQDQQYSQQRYRQDQQYSQQRYRQDQQYTQQTIRKPTQPVKPDPPTPQPPYVKVTSTSDECGKIADENGMTPFKEWGKLTESMKTTWGQQGCDQKMCQYWAKKYNIKPLEDGGSMPEDLNPIWNHEMMQCNFRAGPYSPAQCEAVSLKFRTLPIGIWGATPEYVKPLWTQGNCDVVMCGIWKKQFSVVKGETYGSLPPDFKRIWDDPGLLCTDKI